MSAPTPKPDGFWWGRWRDDHDNSIGIVPIMFFGDDEDERGETGGAEPVAPIPSPAVCAALARYAEALGAIDPSVSGSFEDDRWAEANMAFGALNAALRAERDGAA